MPPGLSTTERQARRGHYPAGTGRGTPPARC